jgi:signal transduction histidine kinase
MVSGIVHELNNPLTGISGFSKLLLSEISETKHKHEVETIYSESVRCQKLVSNLLSFARVNKTERMSLNINAIIESVLEIQAAQFKKDKIEICTEFCEPIPTVFVDFHEFQQVFLNILMNALQAIKETNKSGKIHIQTGYESKTVIVHIKDNGPGFEEKNCNKRFEPFFTTKKPGKGTGLGLSISFDIIKKHNGKVYAGNNEDGGSVFTIELPAEHRILDKLTIISDINKDVKSRVEEIDPSVITSLEL